MNNIINNIVIAQEIEIAHAVMRRNRVRHVAADAFNISDKKFYKIFIKFLFFLCVHRYI